LARAIAETIKSKLEERNLSTDLVKVITADLTFGTAAILDGEAVIKLEEGTLQPNIAFQTDEETLVWNGSASYMHDEVYGWVYDLFPK
jgi:hypothetical protein